MHLRNEACVAGFMGNESERGTNKSRESRAICLFRAPIHSP